MATTKRVKDVAIIGGGIAGMFCAYILSRNGDKKVYLFDEADRLGGRIRTIRLDENDTLIDASSLAEEGGMDNLEFRAEFGPMRVDLKTQRLLNALLRVLGFSEKGKPVDSFQDFPPYTSPSSSHDPQYELPPSETGKTPLELLQLAILRILLRISIHGDGVSKGTTFQDWQSRLKQEVAIAVGASESVLPKFMDLLRDHLSLEMLWDIQTRGRISPKSYMEEIKESEVPLYTLGFWNLISDHLSHDGLNKLKDLGTFYHLLPENPNGAEWLAWWLLALKTSDHLTSIAGGMERIIEKLEEKIRGRVTVCKGFRGSLINRIRRRSGCFLELLLGTGQEGHGCGSSPLWT